MSSVHEKKNLMHQEVDDVDDSIVSSEMDCVGNVWMYV